MNDTTTPATERRFFSAYSDLESKIRDLTHMAELARLHTIDTFGSNSPDETEEGKRERGIALFAVAHLEQMVKDLEKAWDAGFWVWSAIRGERKRGIGSATRARREGGFRAALSFCEL